VIDVTATIRSQCDLYGSCLSPIGLPTSSPLILHQSRAHVLYLRADHFAPVGALEICFAGEQPKRTCHLERFEVAVLLISVVYEFTISFDMYDVGISL